MNQTFQGPPLFLHEVDQVEASYRNEQAAINDGRFLESEDGKRSAQAYRIEAQKLQGGRSDDTVITRPDSDHVAEVIPVGHPAHTTLRGAKIATDREMLARKTLQLGHEVADRYREIGDETGAEAIEQSMQNTYDDIPAYRMAREAGQQSGEEPSTSQ